MKKKLLFFLFFAIGAFYSFALHHNTASYKPILNNSVWLSSELDFEGYTNSLQTIIGDTVINGSNYKIIYRLYVQLPGINNNPYTIGGYDYLFYREDTVTKQLFQYRQWMGESLIFDFSMQIGDTLQSINFPGYALTTIDSMITSQGYRRRFTFSNNPAQPIIWVEGIGNLTLPFVNDALYDTVFAQILCVHENGTLEYEYPYFVPVTCGLYNSITEGEDNNNVFVFPNPNNGHFKIICDYGRDTPKNIWIYDALGNIITSKVAILSNELQLDLSLYPKGVYYIKVTSENQTSIKKIILI